jgi:ribosomal protein S18 acetylase RimI-like enzyme
MDFIIRKASIEDAPGIARVHIDVWKEVYSGIVPSPYLEQLNYEAREQRWRDILVDSTWGRTTFVATESTGPIVGFTSLGPGRDAGFSNHGEVFAIYVYQRYRGLGLGGMMINKAFTFLANSGFKEFYLWVLKANPARSFYVRLGACEAGERTIEIGGAPLQEIRMEWR